LAAVYVPTLALGAATVSAASYAAFQFMTDASTAVQWDDVLWIACCLTGATSFLSGAIFTVLGQVLRGTAVRDSSAAARLPLLNTSGATCGSLAAPFILLPVLGIERAIFALAVLYALTGLAALGLPLAWTPAARRVTGVALIAALLALLRFPFGLMASDYV